MANSRSYMIKIDTRGTRMRVDEVAQLIQRAVDEAFKQRKVTLRVKACRVVTLPTEKYLTHLERYSRYNQDKYNALYRT